jgi:hypothetical protein
MRRIPIAVGMHFIPNPFHPLVPLWNYSNTHPQNKNNNKDSGSRFLSGKGFQDNEDKVEDQAQVTQLHRLYHRNPPSRINLPPPLQGLTTTSRIHRGLIFPSEVVHLAIMTDAQKHSLAVRNGRRSGEAWAGKEREAVLDTFRLRALKSVERQQEVYGGL